jgi:hypothetical protein
MFTVPQNSQPFWWYLVVDLSQLWSSFPSSKEDLDRKISFLRNQALDLVFSSVTFGDSCGISGSASHINTQGVWLITLLTLPRSVNSSPRNRSPRNNKGSSESTYCFLEVLWVLDALLRLLESYYDILRWIKWNRGVIFPHFKNFKIFLRGSIFSTPYYF